MPTPSPAIRSQAPPFEVGENVLQRYRVESLLSEDALGYTYTVSGSRPRGGQWGAARAAAPAGSPGHGGVKLPDEAPMATWRSQLERAGPAPSRHPADRRDVLWRRAGPGLRRADGDRARGAAAGGAAGGASRRPVGSRGGAPAGQHRRGCRAAHQQGILHLSLSPSRIFVVPSGESIAVRVTDFALLPRPWRRSMASPAT